MTLPHIEALLPIAPETALPVFDHRAREIGFLVEPRADGMAIALAGGDMLVRAEGGATRIRVTAEDAPHLQMLRDYLTEELAAVGLVPEWQGRPATGRPENHALARVVSSERISPSYCRVTLASEDLARFASGGLHFRLLLGPEGADWPVLDANGVTEWPQGAAAWHRPVYTTREIGMRDGVTHLDFDVFLHDGGRVTDWCGGLRAGAEITISGPGGRGPQGAGWQGFVGDETAVPVIARLLALLPPEASGEAVLVVPCAADVQDLAHPPGVALRWALREAGETPLSALEGLRIPGRDGNGDRSVERAPGGDRIVFFAAEAAEAQAARKALAARGLEKAEISAAAYWTKE
ncbi:siderophore-interacting protein [Pseudogemmobacter sonorensis]|uniref:siderophore-interacting protein n=1 Tax=Pseudogemmobacter sonorensis TaxID=2989681 RepID=UPI0036B047DE